MRTLIASTPVVLSLVSILAGGSSVVLADQIETKDGRLLEGNVVFKDDTKLRLDTMVGRSRVTLTFYLESVKNVEKRDLPPGFFDPPPPPPRAAGAREAKENETLYLEIPILGVIGQQVLAEGVTQALAYAVRYGIHHIVFTIDSAGGNLDEAKSVYRALKSHKDELTYHGIVRKCQGASLAIAVWCQTMHVLPGGKIGGALPTVTKQGDENDAAETEILWTQIANRVVADTGRKGNHAEVVRAMFDPSESLAAWRANDGTLQTGPVASPDVPKDRVIFAVKPGTTLELSYDQCVALGMPAFKGGASDLGDVLKLPGWTAESDYGAKVVAKTSEDREKKVKAQQSAFEKKVESNMSRRESTNQFIEDSIKQAASWDPAKATYEKYSQQWNWGWGWSGGWESPQWTADSQRRWRDRTDACIYYLAQSAKGLHTMKRLDTDAAKLGLEPTFKPGEIDTMIRDLEVRANLLQSDRTKKGE
jgi:hypothetical protein